MDLNPYDPSSRQRALQSGCAECPHCLRAAYAAKATCDLGKGFGRMARVQDAAEKRAERLSKAALRYICRIVIIIEQLPRFRRLPSSYILRDAILLIWRRGAGGAFDLMIRMI